MEDPIVAYYWYADGIQWPIYQQPDGRQYVFDEDGETKVYSTWYTPPIKQDFQPLAKTSFLRRLIAAKPIRKLATRRFHAADPGLPSSACLPAYRSAPMTEQHAVAFEDRDTIEMLHQDAAAISRLCTRLKRIEIPRLLTLFISCPGGHR